MCCIPAVCYAGDTVSSGITYDNFQFKNVGVHLITIDRQNTKYEMRIMANEKSDHTGVFLTDSVLHFADTHVPKAIVAINGYWWEAHDSSSEGEGATADEEVLPLSTLILNHDVRVSFSNDWSIVAFAKSTDKINIKIFPKGEFDPSRDDDYHYYAIGSDTPLIEKGKCITTKLRRRDARTAIAYNEDYIYLLSTDYSLPPYGLKGSDLCELLLQYDATNAVALDGGPSTALVVEGYLVNPLPNWSWWKKYPDGYRYVANAIGVVRTCGAEADFCGGNEIGCCGGLRCVNGLCSSNCTGEICDGIDNDCNGVVDSHKTFAFGNKVEQRFF